MQASSGQTLSPAADRQLQRRVAEVVFVQGLLTARLGEKAEALRLLRQADGYGFPPLDSPLMGLAAECLLRAEGVRPGRAGVPGDRQERAAERRGAAAAGRLAVLVRPARPRREGARAGAAPGPVAAPRPLHPRRGALRAEARRRGPDPPGAGAGGRSALHRLHGQARPHRLPEGRRPAVRVLAREGGRARPGATSRRTWSTGCSRTGPAATTRQSLTSPRVVEASPGYAQAQYQLAIAYQRSGNAEKAQGAPGDLQPADPGGEGPDDRGARGVR